MIPTPRALFHRLLSRRAGHLARRLAPHIPPGASVLDVGSGTGHNARALRDRIGGACREADVVDFHVVGAGPVLFVGTHLPFPDDAVDVCLLAFVLNFAEDPEALLRDAGRVASRRVLLLQSTCRGPWARAALRGRGWFQGPFAFRLCRATGLIPPARYPLRRRLLSREQLEAAVAGAGLILERVEPEPGFASISRDLWVLGHPPGPSPPNGPPPGPVEPPA